MGNQRPKKKQGNKKNGKKHHVYAVIVLLLAAAIIIIGGILLFYIQEIEEVVLVFNLYRERDKTYVCGTTTLMDGFEPIKVKHGRNSFKIRFDNFSPLSGKYRLRIAVNERKGLGIIAEQNDAIMLIVKDKHQAEGVVNLDRKWIL